MSAPLTVHNAQISTAAVEIKTLTITGKQVTLAVFRQLRESPLVADDGTLNGVPWGTVNYHPDKCAGESEHYHAVWQDGSDLRRSKVRKPSPGRFWGEGHDELIQAAYCLNGHELPEWAAAHHWALSGTYAETHFDLDGLPCAAVKPGRRSTCYTPGGEPIVYHGSVEADCPDRARFDDLLKWSREDVAAEVARRARWQQAWSSLADLPQLFIAV